MAWYKADVKGFMRDEKLLDLELRGAWASILAVAKFCNHNGQLIDQLNDPLSDDEICKLGRFKQSHLDKLRQAGLVDFVTIAVTKVTNIKNWLKYQPEYDRQKPYRQAKKEKVVTIPVTMTHIETRDVRLEREIDKKKGGSPPARGFQPLQNILPPSITDRPLDKGFLNTQAKWKADQEAEKKAKNNGKEPPKPEDVEF